jgi:hypothetical protein
MGKEGDIAVAGGARAASPAVGRGFESRGFAPVQARASSFAKDTAVPSLKQTAPLYSFQNKSSPEVKMKMSIGVDGKITKSTSLATIKDKPAGEKGSRVVSLKGTKPLVVANDASRLDSRQFHGRNAFKNTEVVARNTQQVAVRKEQQQPKAQTASPEKPNITKPEQQAILRELAKYTAAGSLTHEPKKTGEQIAALPVNYQRSPDKAPMRVKTEQAKPKAEKKPTSFHTALQEKAQKAQLTEKPKPNQQQESQIPSKKTQDEQLQKSERGLHPAAKATIPEVSVMKQPNNENHQSLPRTESARLSLASQYAAIEATGLPAKGAEPGRVNKEALNRIENGKNSAGTTELITDYVMTHTEEATRQNVLKQALQTKAPADEQTHAVRELQQTAVRVKAVQAEYMQVMEEAGTPVTAEQAQEFAKRVFTQSIERSGVMQQIAQDHHAVVGPHELIVTTQSFVGTVESDMQEQETIEDELLRRLLEEEEVQKKLQEAGLRQEEATIEEVMKVVARVQQERIVQIEKRTETDEIFVAEPRGQVAEAKSAPERDDRANAIRREGIQEAYYTVFEREAQKAEQEVKDGNTEVSPVKVSLAEVGHEAEHILFSRPATSNILLQIIDAPQIDGSAVKLHSALVGTTRKVSSEGEAITEVDQHIQHYTAVQVGQQQNVTDEQVQVVLNPQLIHQQTQLVA